MQDKVALERPLRCASNITQAAFSNNTFVCACKRIQDSIVELVHPRHPRKAPGRSPKDTLLGRQGRRETFPLLGRQRRRETFQGSLVPNVALCHWKANGKHPGDGRTCCWAAKGAAKPLFLGRAPPADGWGRRIYIVIYWFYIGYISWYEKYKCWYCHVKSCKHLYIYIA